MADTDDAGFLAGLETPTANGTPAPPPADVENGWKWSAKQKRYYTPRRGRSGIVYRDGNESLEEAHARDAKGTTDKRPKPKPKAKAIKSPPPRQVSLQEIEHALRELLCTPAIVAGMTGDAWADQHFTTEGPVLARNLCAAAEHNPWLRAKLEGAVLGGDQLVLKMMLMFPVAQALIAYSIPPLIYYVNPPFIPAPARDMFRVPERPTKQQREGTPDAAPPESAETPLAA